MGEMGKKEWKIEQKAAGLLAVLILEGALLGTAAGILRYGAGSRPQEAFYTAMDTPGHEEGAGGYCDEHQAEAKTALRREAKKEQGVVALTFDDGPHEVYTAKLLEGLKKRGVKATFFLMGQNIEGKEELIRRMQEDGHLIGNHSYRHIPLTKAGEETVCEAVERTEEIIQRITGERPQYLRPPYGDWNENLECRMDMTTVFWSVDSLDWKLKETGKIVENVENKIHSGDIILMHDIFPTSVEAALELVDRLQAKGYQFVTVEELLID